jgi:hypothetical protein
MTAISVFSTFTNTTNNQILKMKNLEHIYMLSDSQLSTVIDEKFTPISGFHQKVFFNQDCSIVIGISGTYEIGVKIIKKALELISNNSDILKSRNHTEKISKINSEIKIAVESFHEKNFKTDTTIIYNTVCNKSFRTIKYKILKRRIIQEPIIINPTEKIGVAFDGLDGEPFKNFHEDYEKTIDEHENKSKTFFTGFIKFLESNIPQCSGLPCQGVIMNRNGKIKILSIKHPDLKFYKLGKVHIKREFLKHEIDYRDDLFKFLTKSKIK